MKQVWQKSCKSSRGHLLLLIPSEPAPLPQGACVSHHSLVERGRDRRLKIYQLTSSPVPCPASNSSTRWHQSRACPYSARCSQAFAVRLKLDVFSGKPRDFNTDIQEILCFVLHSLTPMPPPQMLTCFCQTCSSPRATAWTPARAPRPPAPPRHQPPDTPDRTAVEGPGMTATDQVHCREKKMLQICITRVTHMGCRGSC